MSYNRYDRYDRYDRVDDNNPLSPEDRLYRKAEKRVRARREFYTHLAIYVVVIAFLAVINIMTSSSYLWFLWVVFGWGIGIVSHGIATYSLLHFDDSAVEREVEKLKEMSRK